MIMKKKVVVIGAGASGLFAAGIAAANGAEVVLIEKNDKPGRKLMITGKGRCNLTNNTQDLSQLIKAVPTNGRFLYSAFSSFMPIDTMDFFEGLGVPLKTERGNRVFPVSDRAADIVDALTDFALGNCKFIKGRVKYFIREDSRIKAVKLHDSTQIEGDSFILATGGMSYKNTGSTGDGYVLARSLGHTVTPITPSLVPLVIQEHFCSQMQGLSLKNTALTMKVAGKKVYEDFGEMLFTHFGVSGPMVLSASGHLNRKNVSGAKIYIDVKPALSFEKLDKRILSDFSKYSNKNVSNALGDLLPAKMIAPILGVAGISSQTKVNQITKQQRKSLANAIKSLEMTVVDFFDIDSAIITSGGISVKEIEPKTMKSKLIDNLYFAGEVIDVDAYTGGYNLQIAFSTANLAGKFASKEN